MPDDASRLEAALGLLAEVKAKASAEPSRPHLMSDRAARDFYAGKLAEVRGMLHDVDRLVERDAARSVGP
jgi:hypothetical protein